MSISYIRFECRTCGELVDTRLAPQQNCQIADKALELTCSVGHSDIYGATDFTILEAKTPIERRRKRVMAAGG
jgi:hypothetical protein